MSRSKQSGNWVLLGTALGLSLTFSACGSKQATVSPELAVQHQEPGHAVTPPPAGSSLTNASSLDAINPYALSTLMGTYTGTIQGWANSGQKAFSQPYNFSLTQTQQTGMTAGYATFTTSGEGDDSVPMSFTAWVAPGFTGQIANGETVYSFVTQEVTISSISQFPVALEIILSIGNDLKIDPKQSAIFIKDCGFSQGAECNNDLQNVWFLSDLGKR